MAYTEVAMQVGRDAENLDAGDKADPHQLTSGF